MATPQICFVTHKFGNPCCGIITYSNSIIKSVAEYGYKVTVISPEIDDSQKKIKNIEIVKVKKSGLDPIHGNRITAPFKYKKILKKLIKEKKIDIVHFIDIKESSKFKNWSVPVIGNIHEYQFSTATKNPFKYFGNFSDPLRRYLYQNYFKFTEKKSLKRVSSLIVNSNFVKETVLKSYKIEPEKVHVIYYGMDKDEFTPKVEDEINFKILFIGGNFQRKGLPMLIKSVAKIKGKFPKVKVTVIGNDKMADKMISSCEKEKVLKHFEFVGEVSYDKIASYYKNSSIYAMPSIMEAFGWVFLEAMASGIPVIGGNVGGTREVVSDGINGFLVKDEDELVEKLSILFTDKAIRKKFIDEGFKTVEKFSPEVATRKTIEVYEKYF